MTAPILAPLVPIPLSPERLAVLGPAFASSAWRLVCGYPRTVGDLWRREAERDVREHGEPTPHEVDHELRRALSTLEDRAVDRAFILERIEHRRPAMRARHNPTKETS